MSSLFPGYTQVSSFSDGEYETDEEVSYVTLDLGSIEPTLVPSSNEYRLIGLDTPTPFLQLSGTVLRGEHTSLLGTEIIFTEVTSPPMSNSPAPDDSDPTTLTGASSHSLDYLSTTSHRIRFREVQLKPKAEDVGDGEGDAVTGPSERVGSNSRKGKGKGKEKTSGKGKAKNEKGKERVKVSRKRKEKAVEEPMGVLEDSPPPEVMDDAGSPMELG